MISRGEEEVGVRQNTTAMTTRAAVAKQREEEEERRRRDRHVALLQLAEAECRPQLLSSSSPTGKQLDKRTQALPEEVEADMIEVRGSIQFCSVNLTDEAYPSYINTTQLPQRVLRPDLEGVEDILLWSHNIPLRVDDLRLLQPRGWLNDHVDNNKIKTLAVVSYCSTIYTVIPLTTDNTLVIVCCTFRVYCLLHLSWLEQLVNVYMELLNERNDRQQRHDNGGAVTTTPPRTICLSSFFYTRLCQQETPPSSGTTILCYSQPL